MRKLVYIVMALLALVISATAASVYWMSHQEIQEGIRLAKRSIVRDFHDPESARFRTIELQSFDRSIAEKAKLFMAYILWETPSAISFFWRSTPDEVISTFRFKYDPERFVACGEVNAKNGFGAYAGYKHFYVITDPESKKQITVIDSDKSEFAKRTCELGKRDVVFTETEKE